jgi:hypothetical protein
MHVSHPDFHAPTNPDVPIWRYMDLAKFASMCQSNALHFARANIMEDVFEGSTSQATVDARRTSLGRDVTDAEFNEYDTQMTAGAKRLPSYLYLNCWHINEHESVAMWKIYQSGAPQGIAIRSTYRRLSESITDATGILIGTVTYADYAADVMPEGVFARFLHKRVSFEYEREIRAVHLAQRHDDRTPWLPEGPPVVPISVDLDKLVETVYVSPKAPAWFADVVRDVTVRYGKSWPVQYSSLDSDPVY